MQTRNTSNQKSKISNSEAEIRLLSAENQEMDQIGILIKQEADEQNTCFVKVIADTINRQIKLPVNKIKTYVQTFCE